MMVSLSNMLLCRISISLSTPLLLDTMPRSAMLESSALPEIMLDSPVIFFPSSLISILVLT